MWRRSRMKRRNQEIHPDEILIDAANVADFDQDQFEGRIEKPLSRRSFVAAGGVLAVLVVALLVRAGDLQVLQGTAYAKQARENQLERKVIFADRGILTDRAGRQLAWNDRLPELGATSTPQEFAARVYSEYRGVAHTLGYVKAPAKDSSGFYFRDTYEGMDGAELVFDELLRGQNGITLTETDARGRVVSEAAVRAPQTGEKVVLSIDAVVTQALYDALVGRGEAAHAVGAAGVVMDVRTGEIIAVTSYPEYSPASMVAGNRDVVAAYNSDRRLPFLNRATDGLYSPGSIVKPLVAAAAIAEGVIDEHKKILSTGQLVLPNPYNPESPSIFKDWRANGWTNAREAIAVSSDVYFYQVGGGYQDQPGLGISRIDQYLRMFGFGVDAGLTGFSEVGGTIPTPEWKAQAFPDDPTWRVGNTYHTSIGQYGTQVTPLQAVRMTAAIANGGTLLTPHLVASSTPQGKKLPLEDHPLRVAQEGMRMAVTQGTAGAVHLPFLRVAAKTGTAQVGVRNEYYNSWMIGYWPYDNPKYAYAAVLDRIPAGTAVGAAAAMHDFFQTLNREAPHYLE